MKPDWCDEATWERAKDVLSTAIRDERCGMAVRFGMVQATQNAFLAPIARALLAAKNEGLEYAADFLAGYPPQEFFQKLAELLPHHPADHCTFEGDTGNWAWLIGQLMEPYTAAIRSRIQKEGP